MFKSITFQPAARPTLRSASMTALLALTLLAGQGLAAHAQTAATSAPASAATSAAPTAETIENRITSLHASLKITAGEEADWTAVALVMRNNAAAMEKLATENAVKDPTTVTAVDDLKKYEVFAQAHVAGLQKLITAFSTLYTAMPADQKKIADGVFQNSGRQHVASKD